METESMKDRNFRGQGPNEHVLAFCRKHWIAFFQRIVTFGFFFILTLVFVANYALLKDFFSPGLYQAFLLIVGVLMIYYVHHFFVKLIEHYLSVVIVTDMRLILINKSAYFVNDKEFIDLLNIQDVHKCQTGFLQNIFNFGDLQIRLSMMSATGVELTHIPNPDYHARLINKARVAYLEQQREYGGIKIKTQDTSEKMEDETVENILKME